MSKKTIYILSGVVLIIAAAAMIWYFWGQKSKIYETDLVSGNSGWTQEQNYDFQKSIVDASDKYLEAVLATNEVFFTKIESTTYQEWKQKLDEAVQSWGELDDIMRDALLLYDELGIPREEVQAQSFIPQSGIKNYFIPAVYAAKGQGAPELGAVTAVFDSAPHGQKLRRVMEVFGWDSKKAMYYLQQEQNLLEAEAWDKAGDTYQRWETAARAIKDVSKVTVFVGANIITAGGASAAITLGQGVIIGVSGVSLALEVGEDVYISFGVEEDAALIHKTQDMIKPVTEIVSIISLKDLGSPDNLFYIADKATQIASFAKDGYVWITKKGDKIVVSDKKPSRVSLPTASPGANTGKTEDKTGEQEGNGQGQTAGNKPTPNQGKSGTKEITVETPKGVIRLEGEISLDYYDRSEFVYGGLTQQTKGKVEIEMQIDMKEDPWGPFGNYYNLSGKTTGWSQAYVLCNDKLSSYGKREDGAYACITGDGVRYEVGEWAPWEDKVDWNADLRGTFEAPNDKYCSYFSDACSKYPYGVIKIDDTLWGGLVSETRAEGDSWQANVIK